MLQHLMLFTMFDTFTASGQFDNLLVLFKTFVYFNHFCSLSPPLLPIFATLHYWYSLNFPCACAYGIPSYLAQNTRIHTFLMGISKVNKTFCSYHTSPMSFVFLNESSSRSYVESQLYKRQTYTFRYKKIQHHSNHFYIKPYVAFISNPYATS